MSFLNLEVLKGKFTKSKGIMPHLKLSKICFWDKEIKKQTKIATHMDLWKYGQILTIQKSLTIEWLGFFKKSFLIWVYHLLLHYVLSPNNKFGMWINIYIFHFVMFELHDQSIFLNFKSPLLLLINNYTILFIMKLLV